MKRISTLVSLGILGLVAGSATAQELTPYKVYDGRVVINFYEDAFERFGLELAQVTETAEVLDPATEGMSGDLHGFSINEESDLMALRNADGNFQPYGVLDGEVRANGGFFLYSPSTGQGVDLHDFTIRPSVIRNDGPGGEPDPDYFYMASSADPFTSLFDLCYVKVFFAPDETYTPDPGGSGHTAGAPKLFIKAWDLVVTTELARMLGRPDLEGQFLGYGKIVAEVSVWEGRWNLPDGQNIHTPHDGHTGGSEGQVCGGCRDVALGILSSITSVGHAGTFPTGRAGISMATTSCNFGDVNVNWFAAMNEDHPGILMTLYRERPTSAETVFEQIGISWIKHGFFALSNSQCIPCENPSNGTFLGVGCSDTYGVGNNSSAFWLGPRDEWDPYAGTWTCLGSYFDGAPVNCVRDENGSGIGSVNHRMEAFDADLGDTTSTYYYESYYIVKDEEVLNNNIGSRRCTMSWNGSSWNFSTPGSNPLVEGPAINRWADADQTSSFSFKPDDGEVILSVNHTDLGGNAHRYDYALFNWNLNREVGAFSIAAKSPVSDLYFHDHDGSVANEWVATTDGNKVTWTFPDVFTGAVKEAGPLSYGELYNFGFTSFRGPADRDSAIDVYYAGPGGDRAAMPTIGPDFLNTTASTLSPNPGQTINLEVQGGSDTMAIAVIAVEGIPIAPILLGGVPFVGGEAGTAVTIPLDLSGVTFTIVGADLDGGTLAVLDLGNVTDITIQ